MCMYINLRCVTVGDHTGARVPPWRQGRGSVPILLRARPKLVMDSSSAREATQGQMDGFFSQLRYEYQLEEVTSVGD